MRDTCYFISDAHLGCEPLGCVPNREAKLVEWLTSIQEQATHVFLVGDLFEFWMEYRDYVSRHHFPLFRKLAEMVDSGIQIHYLAGNHDFRLETFFPQSLGVQVHQELKICVQGISILLRHGDGMAKSDWKYRIARKIIHSPTNLKLFRLIHPDWGMALARMVGAKSRQHGEHQDPLLHEYREAADSILIDPNIQVILHGHTHHQEVRTTPHGTHIQIGQWLMKLQGIKLQNGIFSTFQFP